MNRTRISRLVGLFVLVAALLFSIAPRVAYALGTPFAVSDVGLYDLDGSTAWLSSRYGNTRRIVAVGRPGCVNTQNEVAQMLDLSQNSAYDSVNFLVLDIDSERQTFLSGFGPYETNRVRFYSIDYKTYQSYVYFDWALAALEKVVGPTNSVTLPITLVIDENNQVLSVTEGPQGIANLCEQYFGITNPGIASVEVEGYVSTQSGRQLLDLVNAARKAAGAKALTWNAELAKTAAQRAFEIAVYYDHTRPNGEACYTAFPDGLYAAGENIAAGQESVQEVNTDWTNSPGHYANMIETSFTSFAAAEYVNSYGIHFWVECFASPSSSNTTGNIGSWYTSTTVKADTTMCGLWFAGGVWGSIGVGRTLLVDVPLMGDADLVDGQLTWTSSDPSVLTVTQEGLITGVSEGSAVVSVVFNENPQIWATFTVEVYLEEEPYFDDFTETTVEPIPDQVYTGLPIKPELDAGIGGIRFTQGLTYAAVYSDNVDVGEATVTLVGLSNYAGTVTAHFNILSADIAGASVATIADQPYTGSACMPSVVLTFAGKTLVEGKDYTLDYANNTEAGTATVTITGTGNFKGTMSTTFKIVAYTVGWGKLGKDYVYYEDVYGTLRRNNWAGYGGKWYYFGENGRLVANGWITYGGKYYYIKNYLPVVNNWVSYNGFWFYMNKNGNPVVNGWIQYKGKYYHFNSSGVLDEMFWMD